MAEQISYTPGWTQSGTDQPSLGDGTLTGWHTADGDIHIELALGESTMLGEGAFQLDLPVVAEGINAAVTATVAGQQRTGWAHLRTEQRSNRIVLADQAALPINVNDGMLWGPSRPGAWGPADTLTVEGRMRVAPPACPDCHVVPNVVHTPGCEVAFCPLCGFRAATCQHAGAQPSLTVWKGVLPGEAEADALGYAEVDALLAAAAEGDLVWNPRRERWELTVPPKPDLVIPSYGFRVEQVQRPEWGPEEPPRHAVYLPPVNADNLIAWSADRANAATQLEQFIGEAQAALVQLRQLP